MRFAYNTIYHRSIKKTFEVTFEIEPKTVQNPNPAIKKNFGKTWELKCFKGYKFVKIWPEKFEFKEDDWRLLKT